MLDAFGTHTEVAAMRTTGRLATTALTLSVVIALMLGACAPAAGPLGSPSTPAPAGNASVVPPSGDATPGPTTPAGTTAPSSGPVSSAPSSPEVTPPATVPPPTPTPVTSATPAATGTTVVRAYFFQGTATTPDGRPVGLTPVLREVPKTQGVAAAALRALLQGPNAGELGASPALHTAVPAGTRLLSVTVSGGIATIQLSQEFGSGSINSTWGAIAQVVYTATQFSTVTAVDFQIEGPSFPVAMASPPDRATFQEMLSPIFVDHPAWGAAAGSPAKVSGVANVFEATFRIQVQDAGGRVLADQQVMASCGTGCWGDFSTTVAYVVGTAQWGTLRAYDLSSKDGSPENVTEYPVWITPAG